MSANTKNPEMKITKIPNVGAAIAIATTSVLTGGALGALGMWLFSGLKKTKLFKKKKTKDSKNNNEIEDANDEKENVQDKNTDGLTININL